jgi:GT2 family glycosyltransferase
MVNIQVAAIVITYNRLELLKQVINGLRNQTRLPDVIFVINNGSNDGTQEWLSLQDDLQVITQENVGSSGGQNTGFKTAFYGGYDWIWTMDDDVVPHPDCLENLLENFDTNTIRSPLRITPKGNIFYNEAISYNFKNPFKSLWVEILSEKHLKEQIIEAVGLTFEGPLIHRSIIEKIGFPDKNIFITADDTEFFVRANRIGAKIIINQKAKLDRKLEPIENLTLFTWKHYYMIRNVIALDVMFGNLAVRFIRPFAYLFIWLGRCRKFKDVITTLKAFIDGYFYKEDVS